jgi:N-acetylmuramate 1-kinase
MSQSATDTLRSQQRLLWTQTALTNPHIQLERASVDAGFRSYWRSTGTSPSHIVMDAPPDKEDTRPWLRIRALLAQHGIRVPAVLAEDSVQGFLLLEDLGSCTMAQVIDADNANTHIDAAITQLLHIQSMTLPTGIPVFSEALLQRDAGLFEEWFIGRHLGLELNDDDAARLALVQRRLMDNALHQAQVATHRDFMPRNLMPLPHGELAVIDFQDMVRGPIAYDPVSLLRDAFLSWPEPKVIQWLTHYHARAMAAGLPVPALSIFLRDADWMGVQRHLKILGIFARLHYRDHKPRYLADAPRFLGYLDAVLPKYVELQPLQDLLNHTIKPALLQEAA